METDKTPHPASREGFARAAGRYDQARSDYPDAVVNRLFKFLQVQPGAKVLEIAGGTGKFTEKLRARGFNVTVVEPSREMRIRLHQRLPDVKVVDAVAEALPFAPESFDYVFVATAFHWFDAHAAYREILRVLKPGGGLGLVWTHRHEHPPAWYRDVRALVEPFAGDAPRYAKMAWREPFERGGEFKMLQFERHDISRPVRTSEIRDRMLSTSYVAALPELIFKALGHQIERVLERHILKGQIFKMPEDVHLYWTWKT